MFRVDLLHRLRVFAIRVPSLAERPDDIPMLVEHLLARIGARIGKRVHGFTPAAVLALRSHRYEGNVRELANLVERAIVLCPAGGEIGPEHLFDGGNDANGGAGPTTETLRDAVRAFACQRIAEAVAACGGNKSAAARRLGLTYRGLLMKMQRYGMVPPARHTRD
ncbi:MAG TPA: helix-turn-helix domain-containing protein [Vicinamibacterales bacterium]|nr:helix-turn-helix domain-containing protein [Vicinamibacterales bacterium]